MRGSRYLGTSRLGWDGRFEAVQDADLMPFLEERVRRVGADEAGAACDEYFHALLDSERMRF